MVGNMHMKNEHGTYCSRHSEEGHCCSNVDECCAQKGLYVGRPFYTQKKTWIILALTSLLSIFAVGYLAAYTAFPKVAEEVIHKIQAEEASHSYEVVHHEGAKYEKRSILEKLTKPAVQLIVDGSILTFDNIMLSEPKNNGFKVKMKGAIVNTGPFEADISFPTPLSVYWKSDKLGTVTMPALRAKPIVGTKFDVNGDFVVTDAAKMADFAKYMINARSFVWKIASSDVTVSAIDMTFKGIRLTKYVTLDGANEFKKAVKIKSFDLPSNHPDGGISLVAKTVISNPSQIGFSLSGASFNTFFGSTLLGPLSSDGPVTFSPQGSDEVTMKGRLIPQTSSAGIDALTKVFTNFLNAKSSELDIKGVSGSGPQGEVAWLSAAFKALTIEDVVLPGPSAKPDLIEEIHLRNMQLDFTGDVWNPPAGSTKVQAKLKNPFGFPLGVTELDMNVNAKYQNTVVANLNIPKNSASTNNDGIVTTQFNNVPFAVKNNDVFTGFVKTLTHSDGISFDLGGTTNAVAQTAAGSIKLPTISFNVETDIHGLNNFDGSAKILSTNVVGATADYVIIDIEVELNNPSNITISLGNINFDVLLTEAHDAHVGRAYLDNVVIAPGPKTYTGKMRLGEGATVTPAINALLSGYLTAGTATLKIKGSDQSTSVAPLKPALKDVSLASPMTGIEPQLITFIDVQIDIGELLEGRTNTVVSLYNPLDAPFSISKVSAVVSHFCRCGPCKGTDVQVGSIDYTLPEPLLVPAKTHVNSTAWPVSLQADIDNLLFLLADMDFTYNVTQNVTVTVGDGFKATNMHYFQNNVAYSAYIPGVSEMIQPGVCEMLG